MRVRAVLVLCAVIFAATLAGVIGFRLSTEGMAVVVGVLAGVAASIPTSLLVTWLATRRSAQPLPSVSPPAEGEQREPRIIVVPAPAYPPTPPPYYPMSPAEFAPARRFTVLGSDTLADEADVQKP